MRQILKQHPDSTCAAAIRIDVGIEQPSHNVLALHYFVTGEINKLRIPGVVDPAQTDDLWRHTCFEVFMRPSSGNAYYEFNFSPTTQWAAYRFCDYRSGMTKAADLSPPHIEGAANDDCFELKASLKLDRLDGWSSDTAWRFGLSAVIEETNGAKSYWALAHPPGKPDFHHSDCFAHKLTAA